VLYTGLYPHTNGQYGLAHATHNQHTFNGVRSLPARLHAAGYRTALIGKLHVIPPQVYTFDEIIEGKALAGGRNVQGIAERVGEFVARDADKPFMLVVGFVDPHRAGKGFGNDAPGASLPNEVYDPAKVVVPDFLPDQPSTRRDLADYYQSVARLDRGVGLVMDGLKKTGVLDETLVIFLSDNGMPFPGAKTTLYDAGTRLPLIVSSPKQTRLGHSNDAMVSWVDVTPTILDFAGVKRDEKLPGESILPLLDSEHAPPGARDVVYGSHIMHEVTMYYPMRSIRTRTHRFILNLAHELPVPTAEDLYGGATWQGILKRGDTQLGKRSFEALVNRPREELYDLTKDPGEFHNVAADPAYADVLKDLRERLKNWQEKTDDPWLIKYKHE
jgi:N-sulfoglucosamine sulfohydrolase